ncbi:hypothetical protein [Bacillus sp. FJAT-45350]|uniref:hypothetical protein n=1 Tax=Bacillus sp. FJAT-45350 TaxID=2011014 RepID=UPI000BB813F7|nr:hypothetical protein [Bacillus sp. FJAT-45350]
MNQGKTYIGTSLVTSGVNPIVRGTEYLLRDISGRGTHFYVYEIKTGQQGAFWGCYKANCFDNIRELDESQIKTCEEFETVPPSEEIVQGSFEQISLF